MGQTAREGEYSTNFYIELRVLVRTPFLFHLQTNYDIIAYNFLNPLGSLPTVWCACKYSSLLILYNRNTQMQRTYF
jgi:hypothetical protein